MSSAAQNLPPEISPSSPPEDKEKLPREHLLRALQADLIGPYRPDHQSAEDKLELLSIPPSRWYLTGFLAAWGARETRKEEEFDVEDRDPEDLGSNGTEGDSPASNLHTRTFFPASLGTSVLLLPSDEKLIVRVSYSDYKREPKEGQKSPLWRRVPRPEVEIPVAIQRGTSPREIPLRPDDQVFLKVSIKDSGTDYQGQNILAVSVFLVNRRPAPQQGAKDEAYIFQVALQLDYAPGFVPRRDDSDADAQNFDRRLGDLQYRDRAEYAVGHGISVEVAKPNHQENSAQPVTSIRTTWLPHCEVPMVKTRNEAAVECSMEALAQLQDPAQLQDALSPLVSAYEDWLDEQRSRSLDSPGREEVRAELVFRAQKAKARIAAGIQILAENAPIRQVFAWTNEAMARAARQRNPERYNQPGSVPSWRLFQLAFLLINLSALADPTHKDRERVELIYFPTGGGKTEAYLGVIALHLFWRRLQGTPRPDGGLGVTVLLRYTLRMLTQDQLGRATTLICAMETIRKKHSARLGKERWTVGMWVGGNSTPNKLSQAEEQINEHRDGRRKASPCPLTACPWCKTPFDPDSLSVRRAPQRGSKGRGARGRGSKDQTKGVVIACSNFSCEFSRAQNAEGIPVLFVDEQIYAETPAFLIATVDKFALLPWKSEAGRLFGLVKARQGGRCYGTENKIPKSANGIIELPQGYAPPDLIVQDELHLISGPLGTMVGLYESAIEHLCRRPRPTDDAGNNPILAPKIIAATATVRNAPEQVQAIFARRDVAQFPPPGINDSDNFFAQSDPERPGRLYVGVCAGGRRMKATLLRCYVALGAAAQKLYQDSPESEVEDKDGYMTLVGYFNSLRELGGMRRLVEDQTHDLLSRASQRKPASEAHEDPHLWAADRQIQSEPVELTSRESGQAITDAKRKLELPHADKEHVDVVLASNMISVGIDIDRLALMVVAGQPKTTSEYIQSSSRVGRNTRWPGLVVTCLNPYRPRDRSHYERFIAYHKSLYRFVEASSATPFSGPALDRGLAGTLVAMTRHFDPNLSPPTAVNKLGEHRDVATKALRSLADRALRQPSPNGDALDKLASEITQRTQSFLDAWEREVQKELPSTNLKRVYSTLDVKNKVKPLLITHQNWQKERQQAEKLGDQSPSELQRRARFIAPMSMRDTERTVHIWVRLGLCEVDESSEQSQDPAPKKRFVRRGYERLKLDGELRPSQLILQYGPGAMVDLVDRAVVISGIDYWRYDNNEPIPTVDDPRLLERIRKSSLGGSEQLPAIQEFRGPPVCDDREPKRNIGIQALEFPNWFVCQDPKCKTMVYRPSLDSLSKEGRYEHECEYERGKRSPLIPIRFVATCPHGHLQDFPWKQFVHRSKTKKVDCDGILRLKGGASGDFSELVVTCSCGATRELRDAKKPAPALRCDGHRPWLGKDAREDCDQALQIIVRTKSNSYFAQTLSSLFIPENPQTPSSPLAQAVAKHRELLRSIDLNLLEALIPGHQGLKSDLGHYPLDQIKQEIQRQRSPQTPDNLPLRSREYQTLISAPVESHPGEVPPLNADFFARKLDPASLPRTLLDGVVLAKKLRETRVLTGFTRLEGAPLNLQGEFDDDLPIQRASVRKARNWLPATQVRGEGIFFRLNEERLRAWEARPCVQKRQESLLRGHLQKHYDPKRPDFPIPDFVGIRFYLLHSLSHIVMNAISLECGYPASSIRERLYCAPADAPQPMAGILLSTGTVGAEGSLGGLVEQGRRLEVHLRRALKNAALCTHDPICAAHDPSQDEENRLLEGAACHGCLYVAECSCERFNTYLDRALLVPTLGNDPQLAFFDNLD